MPSHSLSNWQLVRARALDEIEAAHTTVGGDGRGRRYATQQINHAYAMLLSSQVQGFVRDLHSEAVDHLVTSITPQPLQTIVRAQLTQGRKLDQGNPNPGNIGSDFARLGIQFWDAVKQVDGRNEGRQARLQMLNAWRNAIAHQDFDPNHLGGTTVLRLASVREWRSVCNALAKCFDQVIAAHLQPLVGSRPWA